MVKKSSCDLNYLLIIANILLCAMALCIYITAGPNQYINLYTVALLFLLGTQNALMLLYGSIKKEPFILILVAIITVFYAARIVTLMYNPSSITFNRSIITPDHINYLLVFIILSNVSIFLGLNAAKGKIVYDQIIPERQHLAKNLNVIIILSLAIILAHMGLLPANIFGRFTGYILAVFFRLRLILLLTFLYLIINFREIPTRSRLVILGLIGLFVIFNTLTGSRSSLLTLAVLFLIGFLSVKGRIVLNKKYIALLILLIPLSIFLYNLATVCRPAFNKIPDVFFAQNRFAAKETSYFHHFSHFVSIAQTCEPAFDRMGFLDYSVDIIKHQEQYGQVINMKYYLKSIVDNCLTPGFNVFGAPRASNVLRYIYNGSPSPTHQDIINTYHSDMLTLYGEYHILFGKYLALLIFFVCSYVFKRIYLAVRSKNVFLFFLYRAIVLLIFYEWLNSFGTDWFVFELICIFITMFLFKNFYKMKAESQSV